MGIQKRGHPFTNGYLEYVAAPLLMLIFFKKAAGPFLMGTSISGWPFPNGNLKKAAAPLPMEFFKKRPPAVLPLAVGNVQGGFTIVNGKFDYMGCLLGPGVGVMHLAPP
jgi:hypothetical protein